MIYAILSNELNANNLFLQESQIIRKIFLKIFDFVFPIPILKVFDPVLEDLYHLNDLKHHLNNLF
jgi:hypothetical protein